MPKLTWDVFIEQKKDAFSYLTTPVLPKTWLFLVLSNAKTGKGCENAVYETSKENWNENGTIRLTKEINL